MAASHIQTSLSLCHTTKEKHKISHCSSSASSILRSTGTRPVSRLGRCTYPISATAFPTLQEQLIQLTEDRASEVSCIEIRTLRNCRLGIAIYPDFVYNAEGGGGLGKAQQLEDGKLAVEFDVNNLYIPSVESKTTKFLGLPLPPFLCIQVVPRSLKGFIQRSTGKVELEFSADFMFSVGSLYQAPPLVVDTLLTTETTAGHLRRGQGQRLDAAGKCKLVGVAPLSRIQDAFMNAFLTLPTDCLAIMEAKFIFST